MATIKSDWAKGVKNMPAPMGQEVVSVLLAVALASTEHALNNIYDMGYLPENCELVDAVYASTDIDTNGTPTHAMSFGVLNAGSTDLDTTLEASIQVGRTGVAARMTQTVTTLTTKSDDSYASNRKKLGYKVTGAAATGAAGTVYLSLSYRSVS